MLALSLAFLAVQLQDPPSRTSWTQGIEYRLEASLEEARGLLEGRARVRYRNNSPDTLETIHLRLHLNAFRPGSVREAREAASDGAATGSDAAPGQQSVRSMTVDGRPPVRVRYPIAPDSTLLVVDLPAPLRPGESLVLDYDWEARLPRGVAPDPREHDFGWWHPAVMDYDASGWRAGAFLGPGTEAPGAIAASYDVTLELPQDLVMAATGVPVAGDPGWGEAAAPGTGPVDYLREWYGSLEGPPCIERDEARVCGDFPARRLREEEPLALLGQSPPEGRKRVRWYAEDVPHFGWFAGSGRVYEQGRSEGVTLRVLYRPGEDGESWGGGTAVRSLDAALRWYRRMLGPYPWPQLTLVQGGDGSWGAGSAVLHLEVASAPTATSALRQVGGLYLHAVLSVDLVREAWLAEGLLALLEGWYLEESGDAPEAWRMGQLALVLEELEGRREPLLTPGGGGAGDAHPARAERAALVLWLLRDVVGKDALAASLRAFHERRALDPAEPDAFRRAVEDVVRWDLGWFFGQWLHGTGSVDYALESVSVGPGQPGGYRVRLETTRRGELVMPVPVRLVGRGGEVKDTVLDGWPRRAVHHVDLSFAPDRVELDPDGRVLDWNVRNNGWAAAPLVHPALELAWDRPLEPLPVLWRRIPVRVFPLAWWNHEGGAVLGVQARSVQLGFLQRTVVRLGLPAVPLGGDRALGGGFDPGSLYARVEAPLAAGRPWPGAAAEVFLGEGRALASWSLERGALPRVGAFGTSYWVYGPEYLVEGQWTPARKLGTELGVTARLDGPGGSPVGLEATLAGGFDSRDRRWARGTLALRGTAGDEGGWQLGGRAFGGLALGADPWGVPRERMFFLPGGDPLEAVSNPWVRSRGGPLSETGRVSGGGGLPGFHSGLAVPALAALSVELLAPPATLAVGSGWTVRPTLFAAAGAGADLTVAFHPTALPHPDDVEVASPWWSAGPGVEVTAAGSPIRLRLDLPLLVSHPELAAVGRNARAALRWSVIVIGYGAEGGAAPR